MLFYLSEVLRYGSGELAKLAGDLAGPANTALRGTRGPAGRAFRKNAARLHGAMPSLIAASDSLAGYTLQAGRSVQKNKMDMLAELIFLAWEISIARAFPATQPLIEVFLDIARPRLGKKLAELLAEVAGEGIEEAVQELLVQSAQILFGDAKKHDGGDVLFSGGIGGFAGKSSFWTREGLSKVSPKLPHTRGGAAANEATTEMVTDMFASGVTGDAPTGMGVFGSGVSGVTSSTLTHHQHEGPKVVAPPVPPSGGTGGTSVPNPTGPPGPADGLGDSFTGETGGTAWDGTFVGGAPGRSGGPDDQEGPPDAQIAEPPPPYSEEEKPPAYSEVGEPPTDPRQVAEVAPDYPDAATSPSVPQSGESLPDHSSAVPSPAHTPTDPAWGANPSKTLPVSTGMPVGGGLPVSTVAAAPVGSPVSADTVVQPVAASTTGVPDPANRSSAVDVGTVGGTVSDTPVPAVAPSDAVGAAGQASSGSTDASAGTAVTGPVTVSPPGTSVSAAVSGQGTAQPSPLPVGPPVDAAAQAHPVVSAYPVSSAVPPSEADPLGLGGRFDQAHGGPSAMPGGMADLASSSVSSTGVPAGVDAAGLPLGGQASIPSSEIPGGVYFAADVDSVSPDGRDAAFDGAKALSPVPGRFAVSVQGHGQLVRVGGEDYSAASLADVIRRTPDWRGQPIALVTQGSDGERIDSGFVEQISAVLGVDVLPAGPQATSAAPISVFLDHLRAYPWSQAVEPMVGPFTGVRPEKPAPGSGGVEKGPVGVSGDGRAVARVGGLAALESWVAGVEPKAGEVVADPARCVALARDAFVVRYGRSGNRSVDDRLVGRDPQLSDLVGALGGELSRVPDASVVRQALERRPGGMALVVVRPPGGAAHVFWLAADDRSGTVQVRAVDPLVHGAFHHAVVLEEPKLSGPEPDPRAVQLALADTEFMLLDGDGHPVDVSDLLGDDLLSEPQGIGPTGDRTVEALLPPTESGRRPGAVGAENEQPMVMTGVHTSEPPTSPAPSLLPHAEVPKSARTETLRPAAGVPAGPDGQPNPVLDTVLDLIRNGDLGHLARARWELDSPDTSGERRSLSDFLDLGVLAGWMPLLRDGLFLGPQRTRADERYRLWLHSVPEGDYHLVEGSEADGTPPRYEGSVRLTVRVVETVTPAIPAAYLRRRRIPGWGLEQESVPLEHTLTLRQRVVVEPPTAPHTVTDQPRLASEPASPVPGGSAVSAGGPATDVEFRSAQAAIDSLNISTIVLAGELADSELSARIAVTALAAVDSPATSSPGSHGEAWDDVYAQAVSHLEEEHRGSDIEFVRLRELMGDLPTRISPGEVLSAVLKLRSLDREAKVRWWRLATEFRLRYEKAQEVLYRAGPGDSPGPEPGSGQVEVGHDGEPGTSGDRTAWTHDEFWAADPPWVQERRRPSMDELIPSTSAEVARWKGAVRYWWERELAGQTFAGLRTRLDPIDNAFEVSANSVDVHLSVVDPQARQTETPGRILLEFRRRGDGGLHVRIVRLTLPPGLGGRGFGTQWHNSLLEWARYSGAKRMEIRAGKTVGGYFWAKLGYGWASNDRDVLDGVFGSLRSKWSSGASREIASEIARVVTHIAGADIDIGELRHKYRIADPSALRDYLAGQVRAVDELFRRFDDDRASLVQTGDQVFEGYPTPQDFASVGPAGKQLLLGATYDATLTVSLGGAAHPRGVDLSTVSSTASGARFVSEPVGGDGLGEVGVGSWRRDCVPMVTRELVDFGGLRGVREHADGGSRDVDVLAGLLNGRFKPSSHGVLEGLSQGEATPVWVEPPNKPMHMVIVGRPSAGGRVAMFDPQTDGPGRVVEFELSADPRSAGAVPEALRGQIRLVFSESGQLARVGRRRDPGPVFGGQSPGESRLSAALGTGVPTAAPLVAPSAVASEVADESLMTGQHVAALLDPPLSRYPGMADPGSQASVPQPPVTTLEPVASVPPVEDSGHGESSAHSQPPVSGEAQVEAPPVTDDGQSVAVAPTVPAAVTEQAPPPMGDTRDEPAWRQVLADPPRLAAATPRGFHLEVIPSGVVLVQDGADGLLPRRALDELTPMAGRMTIVVEASTEMPFQTAEAVRHLLNTLYGDAPPAVWLLASGTDGRNLVAEYLVRELPGPGVLASAGRVTGVSEDGVPVVGESPSADDFVWYLPRPLIGPRAGAHQLTVSQRIAALRPDPALSQEEDQYRVPNAAGYSERDPDGEVIFGTRRPSKVVGLRGEDGSVVGLTPFMVRRWFEDNGVRPPDSRWFDETMLALLYPDPNPDRSGWRAPTQPRVFGVDEAESFRSWVRAVSVERLAGEQAVVVAGLDQLADHVEHMFPPDRHVYVGLGRSPAGVVAALAAHGHATCNVPLSAFRAAPAVPSRAAGLSGPDYLHMIEALDQVPLDEPLTPRQRRMLYTHFDEFLGDLPADRTIVLIDLVQLGTSLVSAQHHLVMYLRQRAGDRPVPQVHAVGFHSPADTDHVQNLIESVGHGWPGEAPEVGRQRATWVEMFHPVSLGPDGPLGSEHADIIDEMFGLGAFEAFAQYGSFKLLSYVPGSERFDSERPRVGDTHDGYTVLGQLFADPGSAESGDAVDSTTTAGSTAGQVPTDPQSHLRTVQAAESPSLLGADPDQVVLGVTAATGALDDQASDSEREASGSEAGPPADLATTSTDANRPSWAVAVPEVVGSVESGTADPGSQPSGFAAQWALADSRRRIARGRGGKATPHSLAYLAYARHVHDGLVELFNAGMPSYRASSQQQVAELTAWVSERWAGLERDARRAQTEVAAELERADADRVRAIRARLVSPAPGQSDDEYWRSVDESMSQWVLAKLIEEVVADASATQEVQKSPGYLPVGQGKAFDPEVVKPHAESSSYGESSRHGEGSGRMEGSEGRPDPDDQLHRAEVAADGLTIGEKYFVDEMAARIAVTALAAMGATHTASSSGGRGEIWDDVCARAKAHLEEEHRGTDVEFVRLRELAADLPSPGNEGEISSAVLDIRKLPRAAKIRWWNLATELWRRYEDAQEVLARAGTGQSPGPEPGSVAVGVGQGSEPGMSGSRAGWTHDEVWADPPWVREGRRPSMDELIPSTEAEMTRWAGAVRYWWAREFAGKTFAGLRTRLDWSDETLRITVGANSVDVELSVVDPRTPPAGTITLVFVRNEDGSLRVVIDDLVLPRGLGGRGFATQWHDFLLDWALYSGLNRIETNADLTVGGYFWAKLGYRWASEDRDDVDEVFDHLRSQWLSPGGGARFNARADQIAAIDALFQRFDDARALLTRTGAEGIEGYPTPQDFAGVGPTGKQLLLGAKYGAYLPVSDSPPAHPRTRHLPAGAPQGGTLPARTGAQPATVGTPASQPPGVGAGATMGALVDQRGGLAALESWIARVEPKAGEVVTDPARCVPLARDAFAMMYGRSGNRSVDDRLPGGDVQLPDLVDALGGELTRVADVSVVWRALERRPGGMALVVVRPPGGLAHVYWLVADDRSGKVVPRRVDPLVREAFHRPVVMGAPKLDDPDLDDPTVWQLARPDTEFLVVDGDGRPVDVSELAIGTVAGAEALGSHSDARVTPPSDRTVEALLPPTRSGRRPGAVGTEGESPIRASERVPGDTVAMTLTARDGSRPFPVPEGRTFDGGVQLAAINPVAVRSLSDQVSAIVSGQRVPLDIDRSRTGAVPPVWASRPVDGLREILSVPRLRQVFPQALSGVHSTSWLPANGDFAGTEVQLSCALYDATSLGFVETDAGRRARVRAGLLVQVRITAEPREEGTDGSHLTRAFQMDGAVELLLDERTLAELSTDAFVPPDYVGPTHLGGTEWLTGLGVGRRAARRLLSNRQVEFDRERITRLADRLGFVDDRAAQRRLIGLIEVIGRFPDDLPELAASMGLAGPGPLWEVAAELGVDPRVVATIGDELAVLASGSAGSAPRHGVAPGDVATVDDAVGVAASGPANPLPAKGSWVDGLRKRLVGAGVRTNSDLVWLMEVVDRLGLGPEQRALFGSLRRQRVSLELLHALPDEHVMAALDGVRRAARLGDDLNTLAAEARAGRPGGGAGVGHRVGRAAGRAGAGGGRRRVGRRGTDRRCGDGAGRRLAGSGAGRDVAGPPGGRRRTAAADRRRRPPRLHHPVHPAERAPGVRGDGAGVPVAVPACRVAHLRGAGRRTPGSGGRRP